MVASPLSLELAKGVATAAWEHQALDVVLLDLGPGASFADYFVLCTAPTARQREAIELAVEETAAAVGVKGVRPEGSWRGDWVLLDLGTVVVHIFSPDGREYYQLERLWNHAHTVLHLQ